MKDLQAQMEDEEIRTHKLATEAAELVEKISEMEANLGDEEAKAQKLQMEKLNLEKQLNLLAEDSSSQSEVLTKVGYILHRCIVASELVGLFYAPNSYVLPLVILI